MAGRTGPSARGQQAVACPRCGAELAGQADGGAGCGRCGWRGQVYRFEPVRWPDDESEPAMADQAVCVHHPTHRATAVCAGTGDYICPLCTVEAGGRKWSVQYVDRVGLEHVERGARPYLPRPDRRIGWWMAGAWLAFPVAVVFFVLAVVEFRRMVRQAGQDGFYRRLLGRGGQGAAVGALLLAGAAVAGNVWLLVEWPW